MRLRVAEGFPRLGLQGDRAFGWCCGFDAISLGGSNRHPSPRREKCRQSYSVFAFNATSSFTVIGNLKGRKTVAVSMNQAGSVG